MMEVNVKKASLHLCFHCRRKQFAEINAVSSCQQDTGGEETGAGNDTQGGHRENGGEGDCKGWKNSKPGYGWQMGWRAEVIGAAVINLPVPDRSILAKLQRYTL